MRNEREKSEFFSVEASNDRRTRRQHIPSVFLPEHVLLSSFACNGDSLDPSTVIVLSRATDRVSFSAGPSDKKELTNQEEYGVIS